MRVAYLDMTNRTHQCPSGLRQRTDSGVRSCAAYSDSATCSSVLYESHGIHYSTVCGRIIAFASNTLDGFRLRRNSFARTINSYYVDGVSLTYGRTPRNHIWTFAVDNYICPSPSHSPAFVNGDYFLDGVERRPINLQNTVWDGIDCTNDCCHRNNPPWFHKQLPQAATDDIEMRVCRNQDRSDEVVGIKLMEIYVK
jgi:hypothetical protein